MRIAELSTRYPPGPGGVERHVQEIGRRFAQRGHSVGVFTSDLLREFPWERLPVNVPRTETVDGVEIHRLPVRSLSGELHYPFLRGLGKAVRSWGPDLIHVHTYGTHQASVARRVGRATGIPLVLTAHYHPIWSIEGGWLRHRIRGFYDRRLAGRVLGAYRSIVVQSAEEERLLRVNGTPMPPVVRIPPGYTPLPPPPPGERPFASALGLGRPFALFVGRLASNKGLPTLLDSFRDLARDDPTASLVLVGADGGMRASLEARARSFGIAPRVHFTGFLADEALLSAAFQEARIFLLPSAYEAFGLVLLEALAHGTPVIASRVGGIPEFVEDGKCGRLVEPSDAAALSRALRELWNDADSRQRFGEFGRTQVAPRFTWDRVADELLELFRSVGAR
ncbi:MAG TPA: glycosyltransferase family 4 protein [Thermoplasmata archaeon]|nr:glycosyltransferase family 4 protein [Thermoplasmata archaeon]